MRENEMRQTQQPSLQCVICDKQGYMRTTVTWHFIASVHSGQDSMDMCMKSEESLRERTFVNDFTAIHNHSVAFSGDLMDGRSSDWPADSRPYISPLLTTTVSEIAISETFFATLDANGQRRPDRQRRIRSRSSGLSDKLIYPWFPRARPDTVGVPNSQHRSALFHLATILRPKDRQSQEDVNL
jgi:hypothetical protein